MEIAGRDNNLNLLRLLAALAVIYTHAFGMTGNSDKEPFLAVFGIGPGDLGVDIFFLISGMLVTKSLAGRTLGQFVWARASRIYPGLWVSTVALVLVAAFFWSPMAAMEFLQRPETLDYLRRNILLLPVTGTEVNLPWAFDHETKVFNVSLWTLPHELQMYALLTIIGLLGGLRWRWIPALMTVAAAAQVIAGQAFDYHLLDSARARFIFLFFLGATIYLHREKITLRTTGLAACLGVIALTVLLTPSQTVRQLVVFFTLPYMTLWFAYVPAGGMRRYNKLGDYSYGAYIYAAPVQMCLVKLAAITDPLTNLLCAACIVLFVAALSWHLVEKPTLNIACPVILQRLRLRIAGPAKAQTSITSTATADQAQLHTSREAKSGFR
jgi:peptidoglycan/LPS O-acetylase OafA/YrhL